MKGKDIVIGVTGSIACYKSIDLISELRRRGANTEVVLTKEAEEFISPVLFQTISGRRVITSGLFNLPEEWDVAHISLADRADIIVIVPATANIIGKIASGICDDMLTCTVTATEAPVLFVPAMNEGMYRNRVVQDNIKRLKRVGYYFEGPITGRLACGRKGMGHIQDTGKIIHRISSLL